MNCLIIEDNLIWSNKLLNFLDEFNITVIGVADDIKSAKALLSNTIPNFIIADIYLKNEKTFDLYSNNAAFCNIPTIFLTQSEADFEFEKANKVKQQLYLIKPIHKFTLLSAINQLNNNNKLQVNTDLLEFKGKFNQIIKLPINKIIYIKQHQHYCTIFTENQEFVIRRSLVNVAKDLNKNFIQIHKSYIINKNYIENFKIGLSSIKINNQEIPVGRTYKKNIMELISTEFSVK